MGELYNRLEREVALTVTAKQRSVLMCQVWSLEGPAIRVDPGRQGLHLVEGIG